MIWCTPTPSILLFTYRCLQTTNPSVISQYSLKINACRLNICATVECGQRIHMPSTPQCWINSGSMLSSYPLMDRTGASKTMFTTAFLFNQKRDSEALLRPKHSSSSSRRSNSVSSRVVLVVNTRWGHSKLITYTWSMESCTAEIAFQKIKIVNFCPYLILYPLFDQNIRFDAYS